MRKMISLVAMALAAVFVGVAPASAADTLTYNSAPNDPWSYGSGNNYVPSNTAVLTTDGGQQLYLRTHKRTVVAPASDGSGVYSFALDAGGLYNFDWGIDANGIGLANITALLTLTNVGTGQSSTFSPFGYALDNTLVGGSAQNSAQYGWFNAPNFYGLVFGDLGFNPGVDSTYRVDLSATGLDGGTDSHSLSIFAKFGAGAATPAVPEPATWALLLIGFGAIGATMRNRRTLGGALPLAA